MTAGQSEAKRALGLDYLSVFGLPVLEYVELAGRLGCDFISLNFGGSANRFPAYAAEVLRTDASLRRALTAAAQRCGVAINLVEGFAIKADIAVQAYLPDLDAVALMGARAICAVSIDKDLARTHDQFAILAELAADRGLILTTEVGAGVIRDLAVGREAMRVVGHANFKLLIDAMHYFRRGGGVEDLAALPGDAIGHLQLCDVPMPAVMDNYMEEALFERRAPGDGDLPLARLLAGIPVGVPIGLEIPCRGAAQSGAALQASVASIVAKARALIAGG